MIMITIDSFTKIIFNGVLVNKYIYFCFGSCNIKQVNSSQKLCKLNILHKIKGNKHNCLYTRNLYIMLSKDPLVEVLAITVF